MPLGSLTGFWRKPEASSQPALHADPVDQDAEDAKAFAAASQLRAKEEAQIAAAQDAALQSVKQDCENHRKLQAQTREPRG